MSGSLLNQMEKLSIILIVTIVPVQKFSGRGPVRHERLSQPRKQSREALTECNRPSETILLAVLRAISNF